ncbi:hypothetical protein BKN14_01325 [Candidatus Gracilibacteria bacterium HOT-871]|nr:hypothetical protein BKN14_01325 [Candidatus Gracilibacteria bacterium HOT-871]
MKNIDYKLFVTVVALMVFGVIMISSVSVYSSFNVTSQQVENGLIKEPYNYFYLLRSISHIFISLIVMGFVIKTPTKFFEKYANYFLAIAGMLCIYVLVQGTVLKGARGWISIPGVPFLVQPTEFLKVALIVFFSVMFKKYNHYLKDFKNGFIPYVLVIGVVVGVVGAQPDFGTLLVLIPVTGIMFLYAGANKKHIFGVILLGILLFVSVYSFGKYDETDPKDPNKNNSLGYITRRIDNFMQSNEELLSKRKDSDHQTIQGLITIGSGGFSGKGFGQSIQKFGYLPEVQGDFIFAVIVEELGFRGGLILLLLYLYIGYRGFYIAYHVKDKFEKYAAVGITSWILFQTFINVGVNLNIVPLTGVTLPFVSYGGSSLLGLSIGVGVLLSISRNIEEKPKYARMSKNKFIF